MWWAHHDVRFVVYRQALVYDNSADNNNVGTEVKGAQPDRLHWSQAKPLSQNQVSNDDVPVNLADGHYDEAAQRAAFQAAVAEWRGCSMATWAAGAWNRDRRNSAASSSRRARPGRSRYLCETRLR